MEDPRLTAMGSYITYERRAVPLGSPGSIKAGSNHFSSQSLILFFFSPRSLRPQAKRARERSISKAFVSRRARRENSDEFLKKDKPSEKESRLISSPAPEPSNLPKLRRHPYVLAFSELARQVTPKSRCILPHHDTPGANRSKATFKKLPAELRAGQ